MIVLGKIQPDRVTANSRQLPSSFAMNIVSKKLFVTPCITISPKLDPLCQLHLQNIHEQEETIDNFSVISVHHSVN